MSFVCFSKLSVLVILGILISIFSFFILLFSGCNAGNKAKIIQTYQQNTSETQTQITISFWSLGYSKGYEEGITKYNQDNHEDIKAVLLKIPQDRYSETINMLMASGEGPDVIGLNDELLNSYIERRWILDLSNYIDDSFKERFPDWVINSATDYSYRGNIYSFPSSMITFRLIYNRDLFKSAGLDPDAPPKTLDELVEYASKISSTHRGDKKYGFAIPGGSEWTGFIQSMEAPLSYSGVYYYNYTDGRYDLFVYKPWFEAILKMENNGGLFPGKSSLKIDPTRMQFAEGNIGMMFATSWEPAVFKYLYQAKCNWDTAMPPALDENSIGKGALLTSVGSRYAVNSKTSNLSKAIKVWKYLYSEDFQKDLYQLGCEIPIIKGVADCQENMPDIKNFDKFLPFSSSIDSPYPNTPKGFDEWSRVKAYSTVLENNNLLYEKFNEEIQRLEIYYKRERSLGRYSENEYIIKDFDPKNP